MNICSAPALSLDEKICTLLPDMPGIIGQLICFSVTVNSDGSYGTPKNLGNQLIQKVENISYSQR
jgi:hypothetical protein